MSYDGVQIDTLVHNLTEEQLNVYNSYADAFKIIHNNLQQALLATGITDPSTNKTNGQAKSAVVSAFESAKQRFFSQLLTSMKCPSLCRAIEADLADNKSVVIQIVTTGEAMLERRLAAIPPAEYNDITIDLTPREYIIEYLKSAFPIYVFETYQDEEGKGHHQTGVRRAQRAGHQPGGTEDAGRPDRRTLFPAAHPERAGPAHLALRARGLSLRLPAGAGASSRSRTATVSAWY